MRRYIAPPLTPPRIAFGHIPKGYPGTQRTVQHIMALIRAGAKDFYVRQKAIDILLEKGVVPKDYRGEIEALFAWVQHHVRYTKDPFRVEVLHAARRMLELRAGDCDDMTILLGSMLEAIGHPVRLVLAGPDPLRPRLFSHIYLEAYDRGRWIPLDPTMPYPMGWAPQGLVKQVIAIDRGEPIVSQNPELQDAAASVPDWLKGLIEAVRREAMQPRDPRVKSLWDLLRQRQLLGRDRWLPALLRRIWSRGLTARPHPRTAARLERLLQQWGILPPPAPGQGAVRSLSMRPLQQVTVRTLRPIRVRPVRAVRVQPLNPGAGRP